MTNKLAALGPISRTIAGSLYERLRTDIVDGRLAPGERLRLPALGKRYGAGLIPLREALSRLSIYGLVRSEEQKGFSVAPASRDDLIDVNETRIEIECMALRKSIKRGNLDWEAGVVAAHHRLQRLPIRIGEEVQQLNEEWEVAHVAFHYALIAGCRSPSLLEFRASLADRVARYRRLSIALESEPRNIEGEHDAIVRAVIAREADVACDLLSEHFSKTVQIVLNGLGWKDAADVTA